MKNSDTGDGSGRRGPRVPRPWTDPTYCPYGHLRAECERFEKDSAGRPRSRCRIQKNDLRNSERKEQRRNQSINTYKNIGGFTKILGHLKPCIQLTCAHYTSISFGWFEIDEELWCERCESWAPIHKIMNYREDEFTTYVHVYELDIPISEMKKLQTTKDGEVPPSLNHLRNRWANVPPEVIERNNMMSR